MGNCLKDEEALRRCRNIKNIPYIGSSRFNQDGAKEVRNYKNYLEKNQKEDFSPFKNFWQIEKNNANFKEKLMML